MRSKGSKNKIPPLKYINLRIPMYVWEYYQKAGVGKVSAAMRRALEKGVPKPR